MRQQKQLEGGANVTRGLIGAIMGLIVGWMVSALLRQAVDWLGVDILFVLLTAILGALLGAGVGGLGSVVIGAIAGAILGAVAVALVFWVLRLAAIVVGAILGWQWAVSDD
jgi:hypothetical protein